MFSTSQQTGSTVVAEEFFREMQMNASLFHADDAEAYVFTHWCELLLADRRSASQEMARDARN